MPAAQLIGQNGIRQMRRRKRAQYLDVVPQDHSIIQTDGFWVASLLVPHLCLSRQTAAARHFLGAALGMQPACSLDRRPVSGRGLKSG